MLPIVIQDYSVEVYRIELYAFSIECPNNSSPCLLMNSIYKLEEDAVIAAKPPFVSENKL